VTDAFHDKRAAARCQSRRLVFDALFRLLETHTLQEITVSDLIKESGVARSTFYRHFSSTADVHEGYATFIAETFDEVTGGRVDFNSREYLTKTLSIYKIMGEKLVVSRKAGLTGKIIQDIVDFHIARIGDMTYSSVERYELYYYAGAIFCVGLEWVASGMKETPEELADIFLKCGERPPGSAS
jgi:AcrR family transcriptional regulator